MAGGYTISEAAKALGVAERRVWDLLGRGVLAGAPDPHGAWRIFLKGTLDPPTARPGGQEDRDPGPPSAGHPPPRNGDDGGPFRELLAEFRFLQERYGQALLALGEARGEVAALRQRVEALESRVELRLPAGGPSPSLPEPPPANGVRAAAGATRSRRAGATRAGEGHTASSGKESKGGRRAPAATAERVPRRRDAAERPPSGDGAVTTSDPDREGQRSRWGVIEALARADDPNEPAVGDAGSELPGAVEAAEALAAYRSDLAPPDERQGQQSPEPPGDEKLLVWEPAESLLDEPVPALAPGTPEMIAEAPSGSESSAAVPGPSPAWRPIFGSGSDDRAALAHAEPGQELDAAEHASAPPPAGVATAFRRFRDLLAGRRPTGR